MVRIEYVPDGRIVEAEPGETVLGVSLRAGIPHTHVCGGRARCSTCRIRVLGGLAHCAPRTEPETVLAERLRFTPEIRLACQTVLLGDVRVRRLVLDEEDIELTSQLALGAELGPVGEERRLGILFADIRGFTALSENLPAYDVIHILNRYFREMERVVMRHGGSVDNMMGDGLIALFGVDDARDVPLRAVEAGLEMLDAVKTLRPYLESCVLSALRIGVGIHYGEAVVGRIGLASRKVTAIGDAVNFASRIEEATKPTGASLLISADTYAAVAPHARLGRTFTVPIRGKSGEHTLYEVLGLNPASAEVPPGRQAETTHHSARS